MRCYFHPNNILICNCFLATPAGFEPATCPLGGGCSIQLSHGADRGGLAQAWGDVIGRMATDWCGAPARLHDLTARPDCGRA